jgi:DNA-binding transcriptional LysR family regulator
MKLRDIEYFALVAEQGHLGRAAEALGLSTPALSKSLRRLERAAGAKLVKRTPKGVELTAPGATLYSHARQLQLALHDVAREVADIGQGRAGALRVGANQFSLDHILPRASETLLKEAPKVGLKLTAGGNDVLVPALRNGRLDLIIGYVPSAPEGLVEEHLLSDAFVVHCSSGHRLSERKRVTIADVADETWALGPANVPDWQWLHRIFEEKGLPPPKTAIETSATPLRLRVVSSTRLLGFAPRLFVQQAMSRLPLVELPVTELEWPCRLAVRYRKGGYISPAGRRFIEILKATAKGLSRASSDGGA